MQPLIAINDPAEQFAHSFIKGLARPTSFDPGKASAELYERRLANVLACHDAHEWYQRVTALVMLEVDQQTLAEYASEFNVRGLVEIMELSTAVLWNRGGFKSIQRIPLTQAAIEELAMLAKRTGTTLKSVPSAHDSVAEKEAENRRKESQAVEQCVNDNRNLDSLSFKRKYLQDPAGRAIYEKTIALGRI